MITQCRSITLQEGRDGRHLNNSLGTIDVSPISGTGPHYNFAHYLQTFYQERSVEAGGRVHCHMLWSLSGGVMLGSGEEVVLVSDGNGGQLDVNEVADKYMVDDGVNI